MVAFPAVLVSVLPGVPKIVVPNWLVIFALPALLLSKKKISPPLLLMWAVPAEVEFEKPTSPPLLLIEVIPAVLALTILKSPSLTTAPTILAVWVASPSCSDAQEQMKVPRRRYWRRSTKARPGRTPI